jgi:CheY-like chemotaxis protein
MDVLLIEDDEDIGSVVRDLLSAEGFSTEVARNGLEALARLRDSPRPKLILLDLMMPVMDGRQFRERQLQDSNLAAIATVILSGVPDVSSVARNLSVAGWLGKPLSAERLVGVVSRYCSVSDGAASVGSSTENVAPPPGRFTTDNRP